MANPKRRGVGAGVTSLMGSGNGASVRPLTTGGGSSAAAKATTQEPASPVSRKPGKVEAASQRKLTVDVPEPVYNEYEDLFLELKKKHRRLKRVQYAPLVIRHGLDRQKIEAALGS